ncbi:uncharacterized protein LOC107271413 isoform X4 [Cephus cinctus]|uniref:Uncharacterized protein LOC107271413 isoform X4 n=1 Tax=Cephus cinctus TaxID=211228 RepID=A0AAJ7C7F4_CEPCN|nr:uncharacterized protein LOC107271413 isoform X4 [Cephus cinctus]
MDPMVIFLLVLAAIVRAPEVNGSTKPWIHTEELSAERGTEVILPCHLKLPECGGLHSVKWYHNSTRILMFSESAGLTRTANDIATKAEIINEANATTILLKIPNIKLTYEGLYKCEPTYAAVNRECNYMQQIALTVTVRPKYVRVIDEVSKSTLPSGTSLGPINEGDKIILNCESDKGRPVPEVEWYRDDQRLEATSTSKVDENGIGARSSKLQMQITRKELGAVFTCKTSSPALKEPLTVEINLNVHVPPLAMDLTGFVDHVVQGTNIVLECTASEAKPPANVTWYNGTTVLTKDNDRLEMLRTEYNLSADGTSKTTSYLLFTASAYDDDKTFKCLTENNITRLQSPRRLEKTTTITVHYPPIVKLNPKNITVNETEDFLMFCNYRANPSSLKKITWLRDGEELQLKGDHYDGGITEQTALKVKNSTPSDMGIYTCILENSVGKSTTQDFIDVSVLHRPTVAVTTEPKVPVNEEDHLNVSLTCEVIAGYPTTLTAVRWYLDGDLLKELPDCASNSTTPTSDGDVEDSATFCDIDPSKLLLEAVGRSFHGNYSCEGRTDAGWGPVSASTPVAVYYKPGPATISYEPQQVIRKGPLRINCLVADPGRPEVTGYRWTRGSSRLPNEKNSVLNIKSVNLTIEANFTCLAYNEAGEGEPASTFINVWAAPAFIKKLPSYHGSPYNSPNVSIECWVECDPMCNISWMKNGVPMDFSNDNRYYLQEFRHPPNPNTNDFESIQSILIWKLTEWPGHHLNEFEDNGNFTCVSSGNSIGPGVNSSTLFKVDFPPVNMTITKSVVDVVVDRIPEVVECGATAHPTPTFRWYRNDSSDIFSQTHIFALKTPVPQRSTGTYICEAKNQLGSNTISFFMNVQFKPKCTIEKHHINSKEYVVCSATANPKECNFTWSLKNENETLEQVGEDRDDGNSYLLLDSSVSNTRIYVCVANNSIGFSDACELRVDAHNGNNSNVGWWSRLDDDLKIIVIIVASVIVLVMVIICIVVFLIFRRKRNQVKYNNRVVELEEREHPEGGPPSPTASSHSTQGPALPTPAPRWPLKPGVLVHINRTHSLRSGLTIRGNETRHGTRVPIDEADSYRSVVSVMGTRENSGQVRNRRPVRPFRRGKDENQRALSMSGVHDEGMLARANRIRAMFAGQMKEPDTFPGISREKTDPNQAANNNHVDSVSERLPEPETKTFYENLPFHGIQTPPNKLVSPKFARVSALHGTLRSSPNTMTSSSSRNTSPWPGSSGYGSTRSHLGPHYSPNNMPRNNSPEPRYNTLKPRRRKHKAQFYSLRLCRRHQNTHRNYQLYAIPIYKSCPHKNASTSTIATTLRSSEVSPTSTITRTSIAGISNLAQSDVPNSTMSISNVSGDFLNESSTVLPPTPAPRTRKTDPSRHTYQNVPPPVFPMKNLALRNIKTNSLYNYQEHYQQHQEMQQYGYPIASSSSSQLTLPLTRSLHHSSVVSPLQPSFTQTNNHRHSLMGNRLLNDGSTTLPPLSLVQSEMEDIHHHQQIDQQQQHHQQNSSNGRRRQERRKYRNKHDRHDRKVKRRSRSDNNATNITSITTNTTTSNHHHQSAVSAGNSGPYGFSRETSFNQVQDLGIPESYKILYPHYYEDAITECPTDYPVRNPTPPRDNSNRMINHQTPLHYAELNLAKSRKGKRYSALRDTRPPSAPPSSTQYAELHFRDVGQEIDV